jgi:hypothetical protein
MGAVKFRGGSEVPIINCFFEALFDVDPIPYGFEQVSTSSRPQAIEMGYQMCKKLKYARMASAKR